MPLTVKNGRQPMSLENTLGHPSKHTGGWCRSENNPGDVLTGIDDARSHDEAIHESPRDRELRHTLSLLHVAQGFEGLTLSFINPLTLWGCSTELFTNLGLHHIDHARLR